MSDPKKFKPYYIIGAISKKTNKIREQHLSTEMERMKKPANLTAAKHRCIQFATSLNETNMLGVSDWQPLLHLQYSKTNRIIVPFD